MIYVVATIELREHTRARYLDEVSQVVPLVRAERGCLEYGAAVDLPSGSAAQLPVRDNVVTFLEKWTDLTALQAHFKAPHMDTYRERVSGYVLGVTLQVLQPSP